MGSSAYSHLYNSRRWRKKRDAFIKANPVCVMCARMGRVELSRIADHVEPHKGDEGKFWFGRLQALCKSCHDGAKQQEEASGRIRGCDVHGIPFDPRCA